MISVTMVGDRQLVARLTAFPSSLQIVLRRRVNDLVLRLQARVQRKLSGQVLNVVTGALRRSIQPNVAESPSSVQGRVFSTGDVKYARIHEYGGRTRAHVIEPRKAGALMFAMGGKNVFAKRVNHPGSIMPERSFMRSSLEEMRAEITRSMADGVIEAMTRR